MGSDRAETISTSELLRSWSSLDDCQKSTIAGLIGELSRCNELLSSVSESLAATEDEEVYLSLKEIKGRFGVEPWQVRRARKAGLVKGRLPYGQKRGRKYTVREIRDWLSKEDAEEGLCATC